MAILIDSRYSQAEQTTLFGNVLQQAEAIYKEAQNNFERFVELYYHRARREGGMSKQEILKHAQVCINTDKVVSTNQSYIDHDVLRGGGGKKIMSQ